MSTTQKPLYLAHFTLHGLVRGDGMELGRDPDTGGQILYAVELVRELARRPEVGKIELLTRRIVDPAVDADYGDPLEPLAAHGEAAGKAGIVRLEAGPAGYLRKEELWPHLDELVDNALEHFRRAERLPDLLHAHYADAGYVVARLSNILGIPMVFTGHSLGRVKRRRLLASGETAEAVETKYHIARRIEAEETALYNANLVVTSTQDEIDAQYALYDDFCEERMRVIPPGTNLRRFHPPAPEDEKDPWLATLNSHLLPFLRAPGKPMILALSRADERKNNATLIRAYGESPALQEAANLVIVVGTRDDIRDLPEGARRILTDMLLQIDQYDLYGKMAYPKQLGADEVAALYRLAASTRGVFVNPALTEPFGLTLLEAAACGLPLVATEDGGPRDILAACRNGYLVDPLDAEAIASNLLDVLSHPEQWDNFSRNGLEGVRKHYSWTAHAERYLKTIAPLVSATRAPLPEKAFAPAWRDRDRAIVLSLGALDAADPCLPALRDQLQAQRRRAVFVVSGNAPLDSSVRRLKALGLPEPDALITDHSTAIHYGPKLGGDGRWTRHIDHHWSPETLLGLLHDMPGLSPRPAREQGRFVLHMDVDTADDHFPGAEEVLRHLRRHDEQANLIHDQPDRLTMIPLRAGKGYALRWVAQRWDIPLEHVTVIAGEPGDADMLAGNTQGIVPAERSGRLGLEATTPHVVLTETPGATGILAALKQLIS